MKEGTGPAEAVPEDEPEDEPAGSCLPNLFWLSHVFKTNSVTQCIVYIGLKRTISPVS